MIADELLCDLQRCFLDTEDDRRRAVDVREPVGQGLDFDGQDKDDARQRASV